MKLFRTGSKACLLGSAILFGAPVFAQAAGTHKTHTVQNAGQHHSTIAHAIHHPIRTVSEHHTIAHLTTPRRVIYHTTANTHGYLVHHAVFLKGAHGHTVARSHGWGISCVPYAREVSGITVAGNAWQWWNNAAGLYARGNRPEPGSVLNFRANGRMTLGHVAVVTKVVNAREVKVEQANWPTAGGYGGISHDVAVVDVSEANNWTAVRVELGHGGNFGSVYPTYGFIYNRPDTGYVMASTRHSVGIPDINPAPSDLRSPAERSPHAFEEVAEAPALRHAPAAAHVTLAAAHRHYKSYKHSYAHSHTHIKRPRR